LIVDAFTPCLFKGNPAAVVLTDFNVFDVSQDMWFKNLGQELNLPATAFISGGNKNCFGLRWFIPHPENALCGHATLASAHALWETGRAKALPINFRTKSGIVSASKLSAPYEGFIQLDFPALPVVKSDASLVDIYAALGVRQEGVVAHNESKFYLIIELKGGRHALEALKPSFDKWVTTKRGFVVTTEGDAVNDFTPESFFQREIVMRIRLAAQHIALWFHIGSRKG